MTSRAKHAAARKKREKAKQRRRRERTSRQKRRALLWAEREALLDEMRQHEQSTLGTLAGCRAADCAIASQANWRSNPTPCGVMCELCRSLCANTDALRSADGPYGRWYFYPPVKRATTYIGRQKQEENE